MSIEPVKVQESKPLACSDKNRTHGRIRVHHIRELNPTEGDLKEIQRQSRIMSLGNLTISTELARQVACGELSMEDAIKRA